MSPKRRASAEKLIGSASASTRPQKRLCFERRPSYISANAAARTRAWQNGGAIKVIEGMTSQPTCALMQADGCAALAFLATGEGEYKRLVCKAGGALAVVRAMEIHSADAKVAQQGCGALAVLALHQASRAAVREAGGAAAIVRAM